MSLLLNIETSTTNCSVSISKNGELLALKEDSSAGYSHAECLHVFIKELLFDKKIKIEDLDGIVVSKGPGSYTGLRIGVSTAKGLCYALHIPLIAVNTLNSLAFKVEASEPCYIVPMLDARRMEVYTATFNEHYECITETHALVLDENSYADLLQEKKTIFIGNGVAKFKNICNHPNATFVTQTLPSAKNLCGIGYQKILKSDFEDVVYFEPYYLKDFIAGVKK